MNKNHKTTTRRYKMVIDGPLINQVAKSRNIPPAEVMTIALNYGLVMLEHTLTREEHNLLIAERMIEDFKRNRRKRGVPKTASKSRR
jgi:hypothetical protein